MKKELLKDDEALREQGMTDGPAKIGTLTIRPMTALSLSWLQRNHVFDEDQGDSIQKTASYVFLHSEPKELIRSVVNNRESFRNAVDSWIEENFSHHLELNQYMQHMTESMQVYLSSAPVESTPIGSDDTPRIKPPKN